MVMNVGTQQQPSQYKLISYDYILAEGMLVIQKKKVHLKLEGLHLFGYIDQLKQLFSIMHWIYFGFHQVISTPFKYYFVPWNLDPKRFLLDLLRPVNFSLQEQEQNGN